MSPVSAEEPSGNFRNTPTLLLFDLFINDYYYFIFYLFILCIYLFIFFFWSLDQLVVETLGVASVRPFVHNAFSRKPLITFF